jgi:hypothetical protein
MPLRQRLEDGIRRIFRAAMAAGGNGELQLPQYA